MPGLNFREFIEILKAHGFELARQESSHRRYKGSIGCETKYVTVAYHSISDDILPKTLASMIRQSGLPKRLFRKS